MMRNRRRPQRRVIRGTAAQAGTRYKSTWRQKPAARNAQHVRNRWRTESVQSNSLSTTQSTSLPSDTEQQPAAERRQRTKSVLLSISRDEYEENYVEAEKIGEGGGGTVYSGNRIEDLFPVAIKHIQKYRVLYHQVIINGVFLWIPLEVLLMVMAAGGPEASVGKCAAISLLAWCDLGDEILLIMERPESCLDLVEFLNIFQMTEALALNLMKQLVAAAVQMNMAGIFHRDLNLDNILIEHDDAWPGPRVRIIDFGCSSFVTSGYHVYAGTTCYKPPEFYRQGTYEAGLTAVWNLGYILFEMLSSSNNFISKRKRLCEPSLTKAVLELDVSDDCKHLLRSCLSLNPYQRITLQQMQWHPWFTSGLRL